MIKLSIVKAMRLKAVQESRRRTDLLMDALGGEFSPACDPEGKQHTLGRLVTLFMEEGTSEFDSELIFPPCCTFGGPISFTARTGNETPARAQVFANFIRRATLFQPSFEITAVILDTAKKIEGPRTDLAIFTDRISSRQMEGAALNRDFSWGNLNLQVNRLVGPADNPTTTDSTMYPIKLDGPRDCAAARAQILEQTEEFFDQFPAA